MTRTDTDLSMTTCFQGQPISVLPVPNKFQANVAIKAKDLDHAANPVTFSIASSTYVFWLCDRHGGLVVKASAS